MADRWVTDGPDDAGRAADGLGDHAAERYRCFRRFVETMDEVKLDHMLFGLLLSAESLKDELRAFEAQTSRLLRLAQTGHFVRQLQRLHGVLDAASAACQGDEPQKLREWKEVLDEERAARVSQYDALLETLGHGGDDSDGEKAALMAEIETEAQQEEALTLLAFSLDTFVGSSLTPGERAVIVRAFHEAARLSNCVVLTLPPWFVAPFEFAGTFGLSRWGNDLRDRSHLDQARFIAEVAVWADLNHPHVAKFLGACHVGCRRFVAHETLRSLADYAAGVKDRRHVWQRCYEVALALQYLRERGLACTQLDADTVACAQFAHRAVLLGVGLVPITGSALVSDGQVVGQATGDAGLIASVGVQALAVLIVNILHNMDAAATSGGATPPSESTSSPIARYQAMPPRRPTSISKQEWRVLRQLASFVDDSPSAILRVIKALGEFAGVENDRGWTRGITGFEQPLTTVDGLDALVIPAEGKTIPELLARCADMTHEDAFFGRIHQRLAGVYRQVADLMLGQLDLQQGEKMIALYANVLIRFYRFLAQKTNSSSTAVSWSQEEPATLFSFHTEIDRLMVSHGLDDSAAEHSWQPDWATLRSRLQSLSLDALIRHRSLTVGPTDAVAASANAELEAEREKNQAIANFILSRYRDVRPSGEQGAKTQLSARLPSLPKWFVAPSEVSFQSHNSFSAGSFGSVHFGKWFETPIVVKQMLVEDAAARRKVQVQFRREADVWFKLNHINIVKMYGACHVGESPFFVCEYASGGELGSYLLRKGRDPYTIWYSLLNAALGLQYLHDSGVVHGDLKGNNILVGGDDVVKLADFGLSVRVRGDGVFDGGGALGAYRWKAPECLFGKSPTFASDVFSFAMCIIEAVSGSPPWGKTLPDIVARVHTKNGVLPDRPRGLADSEWRLIERMCRFDPSKRVTIDAVVVHLTSLIERLEMDQQGLSLDAVISGKMSLNRVLSRTGALISLVELAKSSNKQLVKYASDHLLAVHTNRGTRSEKPEIEAINSMLTSGNTAEQEWAANALADLAWNNSDNQRLIGSESRISMFVALAVDGSDEQKESAAAALCHLSVDEINRTSIASAGGVEAMVALVRDGNDAQKESAAAALWNMALSDDNKALIASAGGIRPLVNLLRDGSGIQKQNAAAALCHLSMSDEVRVSITFYGGIESLVSLVREGSGSQKSLAASVLRNLSMKPEIAEVIGAFDSIDPLVALIKHGDDIQQGYAADILLNLSTTDSNKFDIAYAGGIAPLVSLIRDGGESHKRKAVLVLRNLSTNEANRVSIASAGGIEVLVTLLRGGTNAHKALAAAVLQNLAADDDNKRLIAAAGGIALLVDLVRDGNRTQKAKAAGALRNLSVSEANAVAIASEGGIAPLVALVYNGDDAQMLMAAATLRNMALRDEIGEAIAASGGVEALLALLRGGNGRQKTMAAAALRNLSLPDANKLVIASADGIKPLVQLLVVGNTDQKLKAVAALEILSRHALCRWLIVLADGDDALAAQLQSSTEALQSKAMTALQNLDRMGRPLEPAATTRDSRSPSGSLSITRGSHRTSAMRNQSVHRVSVQSMPTANPNVGPSMALMRRTHIPRTANLELSLQTSPPSSYPRAVSDPESDQSSSSGRASASSESDDFTFVAIVGHEDLFHQWPHAIFYLVQVQIGDTEIVTKRRYKEFRALYRELSAVGFNYPSLPPRRLFASLSKRFIAKRQRQLDLWLRRLCSWEGGPGSPDPRQSDAFMAFMLGPHLAQVRRPPNTAVFFEVIS